MPDIERLPSKNPFLKPCPHWVKSVTVHCMARHMGELSLSLRNLMMSMLLLCPCFTTLHERRWLAVGNNILIYAGCCAFPSPPLTSPCCAAQSSLGVSSRWGVEECPSAALRTGHNSCDWNHKYIISGFFLSSCSKTRLPFIIVEMYPSSAPALPLPTQIPTIHETEIHG